MRLTSILTRCSSNIFVVLLTAAVVASTARAQLPDEPPGGMEEPTPEASITPSLDGPLLERSKLTGDWMGWRSDLRENGVALEISTTQFYQGVTRGGQERSFQYGGRNDYFLNLDGEKLGLWQGVSATLHGETRYGESVNTLAGTLMAPNLMLAFPHPEGSISALTAVTFTQVLSEELQVFGGKINTLDGFRQPLTGAGSLTGFQNTDMLFNPVFARTVPFSTLGAGFAWLQDGQSVFSVSVYDTQDTPTTSGFETLFDNGATFYAELNHSTTFFDRPGHQGISGTYSSGKYTNLAPSAYLDPIEGLVVTSTPIAGSWCLACSFDQALYVSPADPERMWGVFGILGIADKNPSPVRWFASAGISGASMIAGRTADSFGFGYYYLGFSDPLKNLAPILLPLRDEHGVELYYNVAVTPWCQITPDLQVIDPFRNRVDTSLILGLRAMIDF